MKISIKYLSSKDLQYGLNNIGKFAEFNGEFKAI